MADPPGTEYVGHGISRFDAERVFAIFADSFSGRTSPTSASTEISKLADVTRTEDQATYRSKIVAKCIL
jgi:hypothetical protein